MEIVKLSPISKGFNSKNFSRMNGGEEDPGKGTDQQGMSKLSSSYCSSSSSYSGSASPVDRDDQNLDELRPMDEGSRIPLSIFEPSFPNNDWSMISDAPASDNASDMFFQNFGSNYFSSASTMRSPSIQPMDHSDGYDPDRIPASVFSSKPTGTCDWSVASNESLFSIHNFSFSRDEAIFLQKSEELGRVGEFSTPSTNKPSSNLEPINETDTEQECKISLDMEVDDKETKEEPSKQVEDMTPNRTEDHRNKSQSIGDDTSTSVRSGVISGVEGDRIGSITRISGVSVESGKSNSSFAFPVLVNEVRKSSSIPMLQSNNSKATKKKPETRWFSWPQCFRTWSRPQCFQTCPRPHCFRTWPRCCLCPPCCCL